MRRKEIGKTVRNQIRLKPGAIERGYVLRGAGPDHR